MKKSLLIWLLTWIVILSWCWDPNSPVERGYSDLPPIPYCEENWGVVETIQKEWEEIWICTFEDKSYCILEDFANKKCNKWDQYFITASEEENWDLSFLQYTD